MDASKFDDCLSDMISASEDDCNHQIVYDYPDINMEVIKLDEYTKDFNNKRRSEMPGLHEHQPSAVDAICINKANEWFLIEFKNQKLSDAKNSIRRKMFESLWLIAFLYSKLSEKFADETDFINFSRENITFIAVVSSDKNPDIAGALGATWEENGPFYSPDMLRRYKGFCFKDAYALTESGLRFFIRHFD